MRIVSVLAVATVYFAAARLGLSMALVAEQVSPVWPPTGIALAAALLFGYRIWPGILLGAFAANALAHELFATACGIATGNTLEAMVGAWLLRAVNFGTTLQRVRDVIALVFLAAGVSTALSATIGVTSLCLGGAQPWASFGSLWSVWWLADAMGNLVVAPLLLTWATRPHRATLGRQAEAAVLTVGLVAAGLVIFSAPATTGVGGYPLKYGVFPFVIWGALRFGQQGATAVTAAASGMAIWGTLSGLSVFGVGPIYERLLLLQAFMAVMAVTALILGAAVTERRRDTEALRQGQEQLRLALAAGRMGSWQWNVRTNEVTWSPDLEGLHGLAPGTFAGTFEAYLADVHPEDRALVQRAIAESLEQGRDHHIEYRIIRPDGSLHWVEGKGKLFRDADGKPQRMVGVCADITERKQDEQRIAALHAVTRILAQSSTLAGATPRIIQTICDSLAWQLGAIWQVDTETQRLHCVGVWHAGTSRFPEFESITRQTAFKPGIGLPGRVWQAGQPAWIEDVVHDTNFPRVPVAAKEGLYGAFGFPIRVGEQVLGVIEFFSAEIRQPDDELLRMMATVGTQIGQFIERLRGELTVRQSEARKSAVLESSLDAIVTIDHQGRVIEFNPAAERMFGYARSVALGTTIAELIIPAAYREKHRQGLEHYATTGEGPILGKRLEMPALRADGSELPVELTVTRVSLPGPPTFTAYVRDQTQQKHVEVALRESEQRSRSVLDHVVDGIITIDGRGAITSFNPAAETLFGFTASELRGRNVKVLMPEPYHGEHDGYLAAYLQTGHAKIIGIGREVVGRRKDGSTFPMELAVSEFQLGERRFFTGIVRDISERKQLEEELRKRAEQLIEADHRKNDFLAMLAHELRNPLAPIQNGIQILDDLCANDEQVRSVRDMVERQVGHMTRLIDDLLDVSRITRGKVSLQKQPADLAALIVQAVETTRPLVESRRHRLDVDLPPQTLLVEADPTRLTQVFANLLANAAKYSAEGGQIWLSAQEHDGQAVVRVRDTGMGIPPDMLAIVFDLFTQIGGPLERSQGGLGIGLTLVRNLVDLHGGTVEAYSDGVGKGSEFVVRLPLLRVADAAAASTPTGDSRRPRPVAPRRLLVVDDNVDAAASLAMMLRLAGHQVSVAHEGSEAVGRVADFRPEAVLLDIGLPGMNGYDVARVLRDQLGTGVVLVALTGFGSEEDRRRSLEAGFDHHCVKPATLQTLQEIFKSLPSVPLW